MDRRKRTARTVALMSLFSMTDTQENVPVASFVGDGSDLISLIVGIEPIQAGSGDPSPDNVRPISGWTGATVTRTGKNLFNKDQEVIYGYWIGGTFNLITNPDPNSSWCGMVIPVKAGQTYTWSNNPTEGGVYNCWLSGTDNTGWLSNIATTGTVTKTATAPTGAKAMWLALKGSTRSQWDGLQLELNNSATAYEPFSGTTYSITFPTSAGTVYGGTLDVTTGKLTVVRANIASYNGETLTGRWISDRDVYSAGTTPTIGAQVVYELATPIVYDLTPTEINTLIGTNNIWADTGEIKYIEYNV